MPITPSDPGHGDFQEFLVGLIGALATVMATFIAWLLRLPFIWLLGRSKVKADREELSYARLERENLRLKDDKGELEHDRNRGWDLARWWCGTAYDMEYAVANVERQANIKLRDAGLPMVDWPQRQALPGLEEPKT